MAEYVYRADVLRAAAQHGIAIPALCHSPRLRPVGVCRLCVVDVGGRVQVGRKALEPPGEARPDWEGL